MKYAAVIPRFLLFSLIFLFASCTNPLLIIDNSVHYKKGKTSQYVIIKADDFSPIHQDNWTNFLKIIEKHNACTAIGVIGAPTEREGYTPSSELLDHFTDGRIEWFNHGYTHANGTYEDGNKWWEFYNTPYDSQYVHIIKTQNVIRNIFGVSAHTIGIPFNNLSGYTIRAVDNIDELNVWLYGSDYSDKLILNNYIKVESNYETIIDVDEIDKSYSDDIECYVFQMHPVFWIPEAFDQFDKFLDYLDQKNVTYILPYDYYLMKMEAQKTENENTIAG